PWHESGGRSTRSQAGHVADESLLRNSPSCLDPSWESPCDGTIPPTAAPFRARFRVRRCKPPPLMRARIRVRSRTPASSVAHTVVLAGERRCAHGGAGRRAALRTRWCWPASGVAHAVVLAVATLPTTVWAGVQPPSNPPRR